MNYRLKLSNEVTRYYSDGLGAYQKLTKVASKSTRGLRKILKPDYHRFSEGFESLIELGAYILESKIAIPEKDTLSKDVRETLNTSVDAFMDLCSVNMDLYTYLDNKKRKKETGETTYKEYVVMIKEKLDIVQKSIEELDKIFQIFLDEKFRIEKEYEDKEERKKNG